MLTAQELGTSLARMEPITVALRAKEGGEARPFGTHGTQQTGYRERFGFVSLLSCFDNTKEV